MDTAEETKSNPMAIARGFFSGLARDTIFRKEEALSGAFPATEAGRKRESNEPFDFGVDEDDGGGAEGFVELYLGEGQLVTGDLFSGILRVVLACNVRVPRPEMNDAW
ncbi:hypothetical protein CVT26_013623 [Gymnopilus dilepis]|uniref:Uncharacterized protein n=1 Tax=Gymnopilus dilepis TaxID=231916 RepID=A0A409Y5Q4_9AGAR|nr:hypothetical protein CVT26_013623 [Gymnopilus dilepis]